MNINNARRQVLRHDMKERITKYLSRVNDEKLLDLYSLCFRRDNWYDSLAELVCTENAVKVQATEEKTIEEPIEKESQ